MKKQSIRVIFDNCEIYKAKWEKKGYKLKRVDYEKQNESGQTYAIMQFIKEEND